MQDSLSWKFTGYIMFIKSFILLIAFATVKPAKILVVSPAPVRSHQAVFRPLIQELVNRDHDVTVITTDPVYLKGETPNNLKEIVIHELSYSLVLKLVKNMVKNYQNNLTRINDMFRCVSNIFMEQLKEKPVQKILRDKTVKYDLLILASFMSGALLFSHIFKAPVIFMSTYGALPGDMNMIGAETHPLLYPTHYHEKLYNLTIWDKINEMYIDIAFNNLHKKDELNNDRMLKGVFGSGTPTLNELKNNVHMLFLKVHPIWLHNQPVPSTVLSTWGVHKPTEKILPEDLQTYLDSSKNGVIYISFGSVFRTAEMTPEKLEIFIKVFSRSPYDILWKWDADELPGKSDNIKISKWFPQYDVLRHPNLKLFISHGGLQSTDEAINAGVPLIGIPQFIDQEYNTEKYPYFKIGLKLNYKSLTIENLENAIETIVADYQSYKHNIIQLRTQMHDQPQPAMEHVMWRIEYMLRHGGVQHLRAPAANMSWVQYYELELVLIVLGAVFAIGTVLIVTVYTCLRSILSSIKCKWNEHKASVFKVKIN